MRLCLAFAVLLACTPPPRSADVKVRGSPAELSSSPSAGLAWRHGTRDSAAAVAVACEILRGFRAEPAARACVLEAYRSTPAEYVLRVREAEAGRGIAAYPISEVRLTKDGMTATLTRIPEL